MIDNWLFRYKKKNMPQREVVFPNYSKVRSVAVVYEQGVDDKGIALLVKQLEKDGIMVEVVGYEPKKDFNRLGKVREEAMSALPSQRFDLLMDLSTHYYLGTQYIVMAVDATFKAGLRFEEVEEKDQQGILDMMVSLSPHGAMLAGTPSPKDDPEPEQIAEQIVYYLKMINA